MTIKLANNVSTTIRDAISNSATEIIVALGTGARFPVLAAGDYFYSTLQDTAGNLEIVRVSARSGDELTVTRAQEGTTARSFPTGSRIELRVTAQSVLDALSTSINYQGASAANPATRTDGTPIVVGDFYFNTVDNQIRVYNGSVWIGLAASSLVQNDFSGNGSTTTFTLSIAPSSKNSTQAYINGVYQEKDGYSVSGTSIVFAVAPPVGSSIEVITIENVGVPSANLVGYQPAGAGAVATNVQAKLRETVSVKDFGAVGDGVTDDTAAFHSAFDYAKSAGIGAVYAEGTFRFDSNLVLRTGVSLLGNERSSLVLRMNNSYVTNETGLGASCRDSGLRATIESVNGTEQYGLVLAGIEYSEFDVKISGFNSSSSVGLFCTSVLDGSYRYVRNNTFYNIEVTGCYKSIELTKDALDPATFGANFNTFIGGYVNGYTVTGIHIAFGEANAFFSTRATTNIGSGSIGWLIEDSVNAMVGCTADGSFGGTVPGTLNAYGFPNGRDGDLTTVGFRFNSGANGSCLYNPRGDACYNRIDFDSQATANTIDVTGRFDFTWQPNLRTRFLNATSQGASAQAASIQSTATGLAKLALFKNAAASSVYGAELNMTSSGALDFGPLDSDFKFIAGNTAGSPKFVGRWVESNGSFTPENDTTQNLGASNKAWNQTFSNSFVVTDGITAPSTISGFASIYIDSADGDLKIKFGDGTVKTIVTDS